MEIKKNIYETERSFEMRKWFIKQMNPNTKNQFINAERLSNILVYWKFLGCIYPKEVMVQIKSIYENPIAAKNNIKV